MKKIKMAEISVALGLIISMLFSIAGFGVECKEIRNNVIRLHVLANSDSDADQQIKLAVRDALLNCGSKIFDGTVNIENAEEILEREKQMLIETANNVLSENGFNYKAEIYLAEEYFQTRKYESFTLPAGEYLALKVVLGNGSGHNWWCVMFPPLCIPAAAEKTNTEIILGEKGAEIISTPAKYEMRFKIVELIEGIKNKVLNLKIV